MEAIGCLFKQMLILEKSGHNFGEHVGYVHSYYASAVYSLSCCYLRTEGCPIHKSLYNTVSV